MIDEKITVNKLALQAGVSAATVSRVLNHRELVTKSTIQKVEKAIAELNYTMKVDKSKKPNREIIIINVPTFENFFFHEIIKGAKTSASNHGYNLLINQEALNLNMVDSFLRLLKTSHAVGLIILNSIADETLKIISDAIPVVQCCEYNKNLDVPYVSIDDMSAAQSAVDYIITSGYRKVALINGPAHAKYSVERQAGFETALALAGIETPRNWIIQLPDVNYEMAISAANQLLSAENRPNAIFAISDIYAASVINVAKRYNISIPHSLVVVGFDNVEVSVISNPSITTVNLPKFQIGFMGCEMLCGLIENPEDRPQNVILPTELIIRESTLASPSRPYHGGFI